MATVAVYGIGNPLIDVSMQVTDAELEQLGVQKGVMQLIDDERGEELLAALGSRERVYGPGGSAPNTMSTLAALECRTALAGAIGTDDLGDQYERALSENDVVADLSRHEGPTGSCIVLVTPDRERTMNTRLGVCRKFSKENVDSALVQEADILYFTGYMWDTDSQKEALRYAIHIARGAGLRVVFDVADPFCVDRHRDEFLELIRNSVDLVLANRDETAMLLGESSAEDLDVADAARRLADWTGDAAVKDGKRGSYTSNGKEVTHVDVIPVDAVDSTGAGDSYAAGLLYGLLNGQELADAARTASTVAGRIVEQTGAQFDSTRKAALKREVTAELSASK